jgi:hypothetical protein
MTENSESNNLKVNGVIQVINDQNKNLFGSILMIVEIRDWGVLASMRVPFKGAAYFRIKYGEFSYIGRSALVPIPDKD